MHKYGNIRLAPWEPPEEYPYDGIVFKCTGKCERDFLVTNPPPFGAFVCTDCLVDSGALEWTAEGLQRTGKKNTYAPKLK